MKSKGKILTSTILTIIFMLLAVISIIGLTTGCGVEQETGTVLEYDDDEEYVYPYPSQKQNGSSSSDHDNDSPTSELYPKGASLEEIMKNLDELCKDWWN